MQFVPGILALLLLVLLEGTGGFAAAESNLVNGVVVSLYTYPEANG